jgi:carboxyl-terminal processing protease
LTIVRGGSEELTFEITRDDITVPSVTSEVLAGNIGYMRVSRFGDDTSQLARKTATEFAAAGVKGVILDVRGNPGGLLNSAVDLSSLWLSSGKTVLQEKRGGKVVQTFRASGTAVLKDIPTVVLIDEGSASASEITAGALRDNNAATLIGAKTFGKGSVQQLEELVGGGMLKVTIARWYTPGGKNIDKEGIEPDQAVARSTDDISAGRDPQKDAALQFLTK